MQRSRVKKKHTNGTEIFYKTVVQQNVFKIMTRSCQAGSALNYDRKTLRIITQNLECWEDKEFFGEDKRHARNLPERKKFHTAPLSSLRENFWL